MDLLESSTHRYVAVGGYSTNALALNSNVHDARAAILFIFEQDTLEITRSSVLSKFDYTDDNGNIQAVSTIGIRALRVRYDSVPKVFGVLETDPALGLLLFFRQKGTRWSMIVLPQYEFNYGCDIQNKHISFELGNPYAAFKSCDPFPTSTILVVFKIGVPGTKIGIISDPTSVNTLITIVESSKSRVLITADNYN